MSKEISAFELEDIRENLWYGMSALDAVHTAMVDVPGSTTSFTEGLFFIWRSLSRELRRLDNLLDGE